MRTHPWFPQVIDEPGGCGEAGIGKSALLDHLAAEAASAGARVLRVTAVESEAEIAFAGLAALLAPLVNGIDALPPPQADALRGALALGPPGPGDRLAVCAAAAGLLAHAADPGRLVVVVVADDVQWLDASSRECPLFAARRAAHPLVVALTARSPVPDPVRAAALEEIALAGLDTAESRALLGEAAGDLAPGVTERVIAASLGNPLALLELVRSLDPDQRAGLADLDGPIAPGPRLSEAYRRRLDALPAETRSAPLVAAVHPGDDLATIERATGGADLSAAERQRLVLLDGGRIAFTHPLARGAVFHSADPGDLRLAHARLADATQGEERPWHRGAAVTGPDAEVAAALERAALGAAARRGLAPASVALERSARLSLEPADIARRRRTAGEIAMGAGLPAPAVALLDEAARAAGEDGVARAVARHAQAVAMLWTAGPGRAIPLLVSEATRVADLDPARAALMLSDAAFACAAGGDARRTLEIAERSAALLPADADPAARAQVLAVLSWGLCLRGLTTRARRALALVDALAEWRRRPRAGPPTGRSPPCFSSLRGPSRSTWAGSTASWDSAHAPSWRRSSRRATGGSAATRRSRGRDRRGRRIGGRGALARPPLLDVACGRGAPRRRPELPSASAATWSLPRRERSSTRCSGTSGWSPGSPRA